MLKIIENSKELEKLSKIFTDKLRNSFFKEKINIWVGYHGGSENRDVYYSKELNLWYVNQKLNDSIFNGFGIGRPVEGKNHSLIGEINFNLKGIYRKVAGAFAIDNEGNINILHRGTIRGGRKGIGKNLFFENFYGEFVTAIDGKIDSVFAQVGSLNSEDLPREIEFFIKEISRIKNLLGKDKVSKNKNNNITTKAHPKFNFNDEYFGSSKYEVKSKRNYTRNHGVVLNKLANELKSKNITYANDKNRDLFIYKKDKIITIFEIKTNISNQSLYNGIGQLILYSVRIDNKTKKIFVLPDEIAKDLKDSLNDIGIDIMYYNWNNGVPIFENLDKYIE